MKIGFFISGELGFSTLIKTGLDPQVIFTDKNSLEIINYCGIHEIPIFIGNPRNKEATNLIRKFNLDVVFSINYIFLLSKELFSLPRLGVINFHGSLLPKYRGRTPHVWAIINGEKRTGVTAHLVDEGCDTGPIILQREIFINRNDTGQDILNKFKNVYPEMLLEIIVMINNKNLIAENQKGEASFFGKRRPKDGQINWNTSSIEIYNWIRAQAYPYPGAFTYLNGEKIIIDKCEIIKYSDKGIPGTILNTNPLIVKSKDGAIKLLDIRNKLINIKRNLIFNYENV